MNRLLVIHPAAVTDVREAAGWYDQRSPRLGKIVFSELQRVLDRVALFPEAYPYFRRSVRHACLGRLPYHVLYVVSDDAITLVALVHSHRDGNSIASLLRTRRRT